MEKSKITEWVELDKDRKWELLRYYYNAAGSFYPPQGQVVHDHEIQECIGRFKEKPLPQIRREIPLKDWKFILDEKAEGVRQGYYSGECDESGWESVSIPHSYRFIPDNPVKFGKSSDGIYEMPEGNGFNIWRGDYSTWYKHRLRLGPIEKNSIARLRFDSINLISSVWVNDIPVMMDHYGLYPYEMDISEELAAGSLEDVVVAVKADNIVSNAPVMFSNGMQLGYVNSDYAQDEREWYMHDDAFSGIAGDAILSVRNENYLDNVFFVTEEIAGQKADILCRIHLRNTTWKRFTGKVRLEIKKWTPEEGSSVQTVYGDASILPMSEQRLEVRFCMQEAEYWSTDTPCLYLAHVVLEDAAGTDIDDIFESFGVRTIKTEGSHILLNGKRITPRGSHNSTHCHGESMICPSDNLIVKDILLHKKLGAICSRWPSDSKVHYKRIADYCDQLGYMLSWCGYFEMWTIHPQAELYATRDVKAVVRSLRNCPSIISWEMGDEPYLTNRAHKRIKWYEQMYKLVAEEDESRLIIPSGHWSGDLVERIRNYEGENLSMEDKRARVLEEIPIYNAEHAVWDYHYVPGCGLDSPPCYHYVNLVKNSLAGQRFTVFTEFGTNGLPDPEKVKEIYGGFKWTTSPYYPVHRDNADIGLYGRVIRQEDWRETQACQAMILSNLIGYLRESPDEIGAFHFVTMFDWSTFYFGLIDAAGNCKLAFSVAQNCFQTLHVSGLHGNTVVNRSDRITVTASNFGENVSNLRLEISVRDSGLREIKRDAFQIPEIKGDSAVTKLTEEFSMAEVEPGLHSIEYRLINPFGKEVSRSMEVFFAE